MRGESRDVRVAVRSFPFRPDASPRASVPRTQGCLYSKSALYTIHPPRIDTIHITRRRRRRRRRRFSS